MKYVVQESNLPGLRRVPRQTVFGVRCFYAVSGSGQRVLHTSNNC
jgi:hypothetical protein